MATVEAQHYATQYTGLISTAGLTGGLIVLFGTAFEVFSRLPRNTARKKRPGHEDEPPSVEDFTMAYLYRPRVFLGKNRGPQLPKWPLVWIWQVLRLPQTWYLRHSGLDSAVYVRFITGCWYFMLSQLLTTLVVLLPLHIHYAPADVLPSSISQASVSSLVNSITGGRNRLWVHTVLLWWQSICWVSVVIYVGIGNIRMRRLQILEPHMDAKDADRDEEKTGTQPTEGIPPGLDSRGWRLRTVKVSNIPPHMRNEEALRTYFDACLEFITNNPSAKFYEAAFPAAQPPSEQGPGRTEQERKPPSSVAHVSIVRKLTELHELVSKRRGVLQELEAAHVQLARNVMSAIADHIRTEGQEVTWFRRSRRNRDSEDKLTLKRLDQLAQSLGQYLPIDSPESKHWRNNNPDKQTTLPRQTLWEALVALPPELLDPYLPVIKLKVFRGQVAPAIDYYLTKLNLLNSLVDDLRAHAESCAPCDTAFVTFHEAKSARMVKRELSWIRARGLTCRVRMAPDTRDLDWNKLVQANFRGDVLRGFIVHTLVWAATIIWILPMGALVGAVSIETLATRIPKLANWLDGHAKAKSLFSSLIPTVIITIFNMLVPTIIIQVSGRGQTFVTLSKLHHATWCRYWKWLIINVVIAFCAGTALFTSLLGIFTGDSFSNTANNPLNVIASSFSNGAVFFVSYSILIMATQCFFELAQFMIPWFLFLGVRKALTPRQRFTKTEGRRFFAYTVGPNHTLVVSVVLVFSLLNPLPICFVFMYFSFAVIVFRDHFARLYWRVYYELSGRLYYKRNMRYSLDALILGQVVNMALFFVLKDGKNGGACAALIPITVLVKLALTRWYDVHMDAADDAFADVFCGQASERLPDSDAGRESKIGNENSEDKQIESSLRRFHLPELSLHGTLQIPLKIRANMRTEKGPQAAIARFAGRMQKKSMYVQLKNSALARREADINAARDLAAPSAEVTLASLEQRVRAASDAKKSEGKRGPPRSPAAVVPHAKLQRDDRPDYSAPYIDPYVTEPLEHFLWLPRDPLYPVDLDDSIDYFGRALVSSEGGDGRIGDWTGSESGEHSSAASDITMSAAVPGDHPPAGISPVQMPPTEHTHESGFPHLVGNERIRLPTHLSVSSSLSDRLQHDSFGRRFSRNSGSWGNAQSLPRHSTILSRPEQEGFFDRSPVQRSMSDGNILVTGGSEPSPLGGEDVLRRTKSDHLPRPEDHSIVASPVPMTISVAPSGLARRESHHTSGTKGGTVSQKRALVHEVLEEVRSEAVERRRHEDRRVVSRVRHAKASWRNYFMKAPDDMD